MSIFSLGLPSGTINTLSGVYGLANVFAKLTGGTGFNISTGYRPSEWGHSLGADELVEIKTNIGGLFFDAVLSTDTTDSLTITSHPVQNGANISDHAFNNPTIISMEIAMSDAMASVLTGQFGGTNSRSITAYRMLRDLKELRIPVQVCTRLDSYSNMLVKEIHVHDDVSTFYGLKASVELQEIFIVDVAATSDVSKRAWSSAGATNKGSVSPIETERKTTARRIEDGIKGVF